MKEIKCPEDDGRPKPKVTCEPLREVKRVLIITSDAAESSVAARIKELAIAGIEVIIAKTDNVNVSAVNPDYVITDPTDIIYSDEGIKALKEAAEKLGADTYPMKPNPTPPKLSKRQFGKITTALATTALTGREARRQRRKRNRS